jgi:hypothetical protein
MKCHILGSSDVLKDMICSGWKDVGSSGKELKEVGEEICKIGSGVPNKIHARSNYALVDAMLHHFEFVFLLIQSDI